MHLSLICKYFNKKIKIGERGGGKTENNVSTSRNLCQVQYFEKILAWY
jgi:hypothetical protein